MSTKYTLPEEAVKAAKSILERGTNADDRSTLVTALVNIGFVKDSHNRYMDMF